MSLEHGERVMKSVWIKWALGTAIVASLGLTTACGNRGKGGGGGTAGVPGIGIGGIGVDQWGNPIIPGGGSGYVGRGRVTGRLTAQDPVAYREMLAALGLCWNVQYPNNMMNMNMWYGWTNQVMFCSTVSNLMWLDVDLRSDWLPDNAQFSIRPSSNGQWARERRLNGEAYALGGNNGTTLATGFAVVHNLWNSQNTTFGGIGFGGYQNVPTVNGVNGQNMNIQIVANFRADRQAVDVQLLFRGRPVAAGVVRANMNVGAFCNGVGAACPNSAPVPPTQFPNY